MIYKYMDSGSPFDSVDQSEASSPPCWRVQLLSHGLLGKKEGPGFLYIYYYYYYFLSWNNIVMLCGLRLQTPRLPSREAKGIHLSQRSVLLSLLSFEALVYDMIPIITECFNYVMESYHCLTYVMEIKLPLSDSCNESCHWLTYIMESYHFYDVSNWRFQLFDLRNGNLPFCDVRNEKLPFVMQYRSLTYVMDRYHS